MWWPERAKLGQSMYLLKAIMLSIQTKFLNLKRIVSSLYQAQQALYDY